jgi:hypothetical protein
LVREGEGQTDVVAYQPVASQKQQRQRANEHCRSRSHNARSAAGASRR